MFFCFVPFVTDCSLNNDVVLRHSLALDTRSWIPCSELLSHTDPGVVLYRNSADVEWRSVFVVLQLIVTMSYFSRFNSSSLSFGWPKTATSTFPFIDKLLLSNMTLILGNLVSGISVRLTTCGTIWYCRWRRCQRTMARSMIESHHGGNIRRCSYIRSPTDRRQALVFRTRSSCLALIDQMILVLTCFESEHFEVKYH